MADPRSDAPLAWIRRLCAVAVVAVLVGWQAGWVPAAAQRITGTPGAPNATTTLAGNQLPPPAPAFGGLIRDGALQSKPW